jgi:hypothetical protein
MATSIPDISASPASPAPRPGSDPVAHTLAILQPWIDYVPRQQRRLGLFIFLALLIHLVTFVFIRIDTTRAELQHQMRVHVSVENPAVTSVGIQSGDRFWDRLTDPRLYILPVQPLSSLGPNESELDFTSINSSLGSHAWPVPAAPEDYRVSRPIQASLEQRVGETMRPPRQPFAYDETPPVVVSKTAWREDEAMASRQPAAFPELPSPISDSDLSPTILQVAVGPDGVVQHVLVEQSSGEEGASIAKDLDQQAVLAARKIRFKPTDQPGLVWGRLTVFWHYSAKPREEVVPTPPSGP